MDSRFYSIDLYACPLLPLRCLDYCRFVVSLQIGTVGPPAVFSFIEFVLAVLDILYFHMNFKTTFSISTSKDSWDFHRDFTESLHLFTVPFLIK